MPQAPSEQTEFDRLLSQRGDEELTKTRKTLFDRLEERGEKRGEKRAKREPLLSLMRARFGALPLCVTRKVSSVEDVALLDELLRRVLTARTLAQMGLSKQG